MAVYLKDHPPVRRQYREPRREDPSGVIAVHTAENTPDWVAFDGGAEAVARFIQSRTDAGSYHTLADSDSRIRMVEFDDEAFHDATGTNPHSFGISAATRADVWPLAPQAWRDGCVEQMAQGAAEYARWVKSNYSIVIPPDRITEDEARARVPGFVSHAQLDPGRRTDPGKDFPWSQFLARFKELTAPQPIVVPPTLPVPPLMSEEDNMLIVRQDDPSKVLLLLGGLLFKGHDGAVKGNDATPKVSVNATVWGDIIKAYGKVIG